MLCVVDIGNTNIVIALMESSEQICFSGRIVTERKKTKEKFMQEIRGLLDTSDYAPADMQGVMISSVVPELTENVRSAMEELTNAQVKVMVLGKELDTGLTLQMDNPDRVGSDLIADAVAAAEEYRGAVVIFDMGTATTCSFVKDKIYLGTMIIAGVSISQEALSAKAAQLPLLSLEEIGENTPRLLGKNTVESMMSGIVYGNAAMIDGVIERIEDEMQCEITAVATGGIAEFIIPYCKRRVILDRNLLLKGLWYIFDKNSVHGEI